MENPSENNKRIAKNTLLLYVRMLLIIVVGLYTSRVVLHTLGVSDYGIYNVVGGIVAMMAFLNSAMVAASQRFISYELGRGNLERLKTVFCTSVIIHCSLAVIIFFLAETIGLWFLNSHLNIEEHRMRAANWVYQCSILTLVATIVSVPYNSCIVAHEHMKAFAYISIIDVILKLLSVYALLAIHFDKLIVYAILLLAVAVAVCLLYRAYCRRYFGECHFRFVFDRALFTEMFAFAGWSIIGNMGFAGRDQGSNIILNLFFGTTVNAARGLALQVNGVISNFSNNFLMALNPQITKQYASGDTARSVKLVYAGCRYSFFLMALISIPFICNMDYLLRLWLGEVPAYMSAFLRLVLFSALINSMAGPLVTALQATGRIKVFQITICLILLCELPLAYAILRCGGKPYMAMYPTVFVTLVALFARFVLLRKLISAYSLSYFTFSIVAKNLLIAVFCLSLSLYIHQCMTVNFYTFLLNVCLSLILTSVAIYVAGISADERRFAKEKIGKLIRRR